MYILPTELMRFFPEELWLDVFLESREGWWAGNKVSRDCDLEVLYSLPTLLWDRVLMDPTAFALILLIKNIM